MYTAILKNRLIEGGKIRWVVEFTNGVDMFSESFNVNKYVDLQQRVANRLAELNFVDTYTIDGVIDPTVQVTTPTVSETERNEWMRDWTILQQADKLIASGVITNTHSAYMAHKAKVALNFKAIYITYL